MHVSVVKSPKDLILDNALLHMYCKYESLEDANSAFKLMPEKDMVSWSTMISGLMGMSRYFMGLETIGFIELFFTNLTDSRLDFTDSPSLKACKSARLKLCIDILMALTSSGNFAVKTMEATSKEDQTLETTDSVTVSDSINDYGDGDGDGNGSSPSSLQGQKNELYSFTFGDLKEKDSVLERGPWHIGGRYFAVRKWDPYIASDAMLPVLLANLFALTKLLKTAQGCLMLKCVEITPETTLPSTTGGKR
ncbi:hypothetical protein GIB67_024097 [Kingdonia uniflora]|uniref:Pentatricopeptide repeat-containing protein n=1 Tax=Kingdonia uniflora TaxID=39325 RepID=A0A7J7MMR0_9MAGN|nr:hypothetical protein GIB67_024097 [Kingdonia uniflora]